MRLLTTEVPRRFPSSEAGRSGSDGELHAGRRADTHAAAAGAEQPEARLGISIQGLDTALEDAVRSSLTLQQYRDRSVSQAQLTRLVTVGETEIRNTLEAWGYYDGKIQSRTETRGERGFEVFFEVNPGDPVRVVAVRAADGPSAELRLVRGMHARRERRRRLVVTRGTRCGSELFGVREFVGLLEVPVTRDAADFRTAVAGRA